MTNQKGILNKIKSFHGTFYRNKDEFTEDVNLNEILGNVPTIQLNDEDKLNLKKTIDIKEISKEVNSLKNNRSPVSDGYSAEMFKFFWPDLKYILLRSIIEGCQMGELSISQKWGMISILPKGGKPREVLKK